MKQTLLMLLECRRRGGGLEDYAQVISSRLPNEEGPRRIYLGQMGEFIATALDGWVRDPEEY